MKSFTDIEQSEKLAEILPLKSADMCYPLPCEDKDKPLLEQGGFGSIPCWSLAALISILPRYLNYNDGKCQLNLYTIDFENLYRKDHCWVVGYCDYDEECEEYNFQIQAREDEVIDACYELILKLNERKLLN